MPSALGRRVTPRRLRALAMRGLLDADALEDALLLVGGRASPESWYAFLRRRLLVVGVVLVAVGGVMFVAANWERLSDLLRLGLIAAGIVGSAALAVHVGLSSVGGRAATMLSGLLIGPLLAVYGQTYQTGADAYELFLGWTTLLLPFALVARFGGLWLFAALLGELTLFLFWQQTFGLTGSPVRGGPLFLLLSGLNAALALGWEALRRRGVPWLQGRYGPRLFMTLALVVSAGLLDIYLVEATFGRASVPIALAALVFLVVHAAAFGVYRFLARDLLVLAVLGLTVSSVAAVLVAILLFRELRLELGGVLLLGLFILGEMALLGAWLRREHGRSDG